MTQAILQSINATFNRGARAVPLQSLIGADLRPQGFQKLRFRSFYEKKPVASSVRLRPQLALGRGGVASTVGAAQEMHGNNAVALGDIAHVVAGNGKRKGFRP